MSVRAENSIKDVFAAGNPATHVRAPFTSGDFALYGTVILAWGFSWYFIHLQGGVDPEISVVWRFLIAAPLMMGLAVIRGESLRFPLADHLRFMVLGTAIFSTNFTLFYYATQLMASGLVAIVFSLAAVLNMALNALVFRVPISARLVAGGVLGMFGIAAIYGPAIAGSHLESSAIVGLLLSLAGTLAFCIGNMVSASLQRRGIRVFAATAWGMTYGCVLLAAFAAAKGLPFRIEPNLAYISGLVYLGVIASVMTFACYFTLLGRVGVDRAGYVTVGSPVIAIIVSTFTESYHWAWPAFLGVAAVIVGNLLVLRPQRR